jgi:hypothetical protein
VTPPGKAQAAASRYGPLHPELTPVAPLFLAYTSYAFSPVGRTLSLRTGAVLRQGSWILRPDMERVSPVLYFPFEVKGPAFAVTNAGTAGVGCICS